MGQSDSELTPISTAKEAVIFIPREKVHPDPDFPVMLFRGFTDGNGMPNPELVYGLAKQVIDDRTVQGDGIVTSTSEATKFSGRGLTSKSVMTLETTDGMRTISSIKTKSTGMPRIARVSWQDYKDRKTPFFYHVPTQPHGDQRTDLVKRKAFLGLGSHLVERNRLDAENSLLLHKRGVKVRLPIAGRTIDSLKVWDDSTSQLVDRDVAWFKQQGFKDDELYQSDWGLSCPITLEDTNDFLLNQTREQINLSKIGEFVISLMQLARQDKTPEYQYLYHKWQKRLVRGESLSQDETISALEDFGIALSQTAGKNYEGMYNGGKSHYTHGVLHDQNISFFGEFCDNFTVKEGLLEVGLAPENSADIDGLRKAFKRYAAVILRLKGEPYDLDMIGKAQAFAEEKFYPEIIENWPSYEEYCSKAYRQEIEKCVLEIADRLKIGDDFIVSQYEEVRMDSRYERALENDVIYRIAEKRIGLPVYPFGEPDIDYKKTMKDLISIQEQRFGDFISDVDAELETAINNREVQFVYQRGIGFADGNNSRTRFIETSDFGSERPMFGSCVVLMAWSPETKLGCVLHADTLTDIKSAKNLMESKFGGKSVQVSIVGGQTDNSEGILVEMNEVFSNMQDWVMTRMDVLGPKFTRTRQIVFDSQTGKVYNLQGDARKNMKPWSYEQPDEIKIRSSKAAMTNKSLEIDLE